VLVTTLDEVADPAIALARLYRERADAEKIYDELKNQWGRGGFTPRRLDPTRLMANRIALGYNWWHHYARLYDGDHQHLATPPLHRGAMSVLLRCGLVHGEPGGLQSPSCLA